MRSTPVEGRQQAAGDDVLFFGAVSQVPGIYDAGGHTAEVESKQSANLVDISCRGVYGDRLGAIDVVLC